MAATGTVDLSAVCFRDVLEFRRSLRATGRALSGRAAWPHHDRGHATTTLGVRLVDRNTEDLTEADLAWVDMVMTGGMLPQQADPVALIELPSE